MPLQVTNIKAEPFGMGHTVHLAWKNPTDSSFKEVVIHRRTDQYSLDPASPFSVEIYRGNGTEVYDYHLVEPAVTSINSLPIYDEQTDEEKEQWLEGEFLYCYTFFTVDQEDNYYASYGTTKACAPTKRYGLGKFLYDQLPYIYDKKDQDEEHQLKRYCELLGFEFDHMYSIIKMSRYLLKPGKLSPDFLSALSGMIGWNLDRTLPQVTQRRILQNAINIYKYAGTKLGLTALVKYYSGFPSTSSVYEQYPHLMHSVYFGTDPLEDPLYTDNIIPDFTTLDITKIGTTDDQLYYMWDFSPGARISYNKVIADIKPTVPLTTEERQAIYDRVARILDEFVPIHVNYEININ